MIEKKLIVFGGAFNPPTKAHLKLALAAMKYIKAEKVVFVPVNDEYKKGDLISIVHRVNMLKTIENKTFQVFVSPSIDNRDPYTIETLRRIREEYGDYEIYFLMGADNLRQIETWYDYEALLKEFKLLVSQRDDLVIDEIINTIEVLRKNAENIYEIPRAVIEKISSTLVRKLIGLRDRKFKSYISEPIYEYILHHDLYLKG